MRNVLTGLFITLSVGLATAAAIRVPAAPAETMLVSVDELAAHISDASLVVLQVGDAKTYAAGHIPGARFAEMRPFLAPPETDPEKRKTQVRTELPTDAALLATLESFGITDRSRIVLAESDNYHSPSTRIYLTLVHAGLGANTRILDGGLTAWTAAGHPTSQETPPAVRTTLAPLKTVAVTVDAAFVQAHEHTPGTVILDVRDPAGWAGTEPATDDTVTPARYGHIPGALSLPLERLWNDDTGRLRPRAELEKVFAEVGVKPADEVIGYCYVGQRATATLFAAQLLGHRTYLYDGSMDEWTKLKLPLEMPGGKDGRR